MYKFVCTMLLGAGLFAAPGGQAAPLLTADDPVVVDAAMAAGLDPLLLYAIALQESGRAWSDGVRRPHPYVVRIDGRGVYAESPDQILRVWTVAQQRNDNIEDLGPMHINLRWHGHRVDDPAKLLDPAVNFAVAAQILRESIETAPDLATGIGRYHHTTHPQRTEWYAGRVLSIYQKLLRGAH